MQQINFTLSPENFTNIPFQKYPKNFTFVVNGKQYETNRVIADILSPKIRKLHFTDESINEYHINTKKNKSTTTIKKEDSEEKDYFQDFLQLATFSDSKLDIYQQMHFIDYFFQLGNINEYALLQKELFTKITIDNSIDLLFHLCKIERECDEKFNFITEPIQKLISFISNHFEFIDKEKLKKLNLDEIELIIQNPSLKLKDEDSLLEFILSLYEKDEIYSVLFEYVQFRNLSEKKFLTFINSIDFSALNPKIWYMVRPNIISKSQPTDFSSDDTIRYFASINDFSYKKGQEFNGIMNFLVKKTGGNINDNGTIKIDSNSIHNNDRLPKNLVDFSDTNVYQSTDDGDAIISFDFKSMFVQLSSYSIKSCNSNENGAHLKNWVIEVSNDGQNWKEIDRNENCSSLRGNYKSVNFIVVLQTNDFYRFVRLRQTGKSWWYLGENNYLTLCNIEFFGKLKYSDDFKL